MDSPAEGPLTHCGEFRLRLQPEWRAGGANLFFDEIIIIEKPFGRRRKPVPVFQAGGDLFIFFLKNRFIVFQPRKEAIGPAAETHFRSSDAMPAGEGFGVASAGR